MSIKTYLLLAVLALSATGCVSFTPTGPLAPSQQFASKTLPYAAMLDSVEVSDPKINEDQQRTIADQLSVQLVPHLQRGEYFEKVVTFPAKLQGNDVTLHFNFASLKARRTPHPAYIPGALVTLTMWIWFNGPIYVDSYDIAAELTIKDTNGKVLAASTKMLKQDQNTGLWDKDYMFPNGAKQLSTVIDQLLSESTQRLQSN